MTVVIGLFAAFTLLLLVGWVIFFKFPENYSIRYKLVKFCRSERTREEIRSRFAFLPEDELEFFLVDLLLEQKIASRFDLETSEWRYLSV